MKFSNDFWRHILIGGGGAAGLALIQFLGHQDFGQWNVLAQLVFQGGAELLNQVVAQDKAPPAVGGVGGRDPNIMRGLGILVAMGVALAMAPGHARADPKPVVVARSQTPIEFNNGSASGATGLSTQDNLFAGLADPFKQLADFITSDFVSAAALSTSIPGLIDGNGHDCWATMAQAGAILKAHPIPITLHGATDLEALRLFNAEANKVCGTTQCTQVFTELTNGIKTLAPVSTPLPIPSFTDICAKVPVVALVAPQIPDVPPATPAVK